MRNANYSEARLTSLARPNRTGVSRVTSDPADGCVSVSAAIVPERQIDYWAAFRRNRWILLLFPLLGAAGGYLYSRTQRPVYQARTTLEIRLLNDNFLNTREVTPTGALTENAIEPYIQAQVEILRDPALIGKVIERLKLDQRRGPDSREAAIHAALRNITVVPVIPARMLRIAYDSIEPVLAANFANRLAQEYIQQKIDSRQDAARKTTEWLASQSQQLKEKLERSERDLQDYARSTGLLYTNDRDTAAEEKLRALDRELAVAQADRIAKQSQLAMIAASDPEMLPQAMASGRLQEYEGKLTDLRRQRAELLTLLTPENYKVQRIDAQIAEIETALNSQMKRIPEALRNEFSAAEKREGLLATAYAHQAKQVSDDAIKAIHYLTLKQQVEATRALHAAFMQRTEQAAMMAALPESNTFVVAPATPPASPYKPNTFLLTSLGLFAGIFCGVCLAGLREFTDNSIKAPGECSTSLNVRELGVIPSAKVDRRALARRGPIGRGAGQRRKLDRITLECKNSILAESFRGALASICFSADTSGARVLLFTSPGPHEGKTTVVSNLGFALAGIDRNILLINADSRHPRLHDIFDVGQKRGMADLLEDTCDLAECELEEYIGRTHIPHLAVMGSGSGESHISRLLHSERLPMLIERLRREFSIILIDSPPVRQISDARVLARSCDGVVLVVRAGATTLSSAADAVALFEADDTPVLGTILNDWDPKAGNSETSREFSKMYRHYYHCSMI